MGGSRCRGEKPKGDVLAEKKKWLLVEKSAVGENGRGKGARGGCGEVLQVGKGDNHPKKMFAVRKEGVGGESARGGFKRGGKRRASHGGGEG